MKNRILYSIFYALITMLLIFSGCSKSDKPASISEKITIGYPYLRIALPVIVADYKGFFKKHGLNVELKSYETAQPMMDAIVSGKIDLGGFCALPITFGAMARSKTELLFLGGMFEDNEHPISILIVRPKSEIKTIKDLKGKKIGILPTRAYEVWLQEILKGNGIAPQDVIIRQVKPNLQADALNGGSVDALFTNDPAATITISKGYGVKLTQEALVPKTSKMYPFYFGSFNVRKDFAIKRPEIVRAVSKALDEASQFINNNPEAKLIMSRDEYLPQAFRPIVKNFPNSLFKLSNQVSNSELEEIKNYYYDKKVLPINIEVKGLQYKR